jgi:hypothetical protein
MDEARRETRTSVVRISEVGGWYSCSLDVWSGQTSLPGVPYLCEVEADRDRGADCW